MKNEYDQQQLSSEHMRQTYSESYGDLYAREHTNEYNETAPHNNRNTDTVNSEHNYSNNYNQENSIAFGNTTYDSSYDVEGNEHQQYYQDYYPTTKESHGYDNNVYNENYEAKLSDASIQNEHANSSYTNDASPKFVYDISDDSEDEVKADNVYTSDYIESKDDTHYQPHANDYIESTYDDFNSAIHDKSHNYNNSDGSSHAEHNLSTTDEVGSDSTYAVVQSNGSGRVRRGKTSFSYSNTKSQESSNNTSIEGPTHLSSVTPPSNHVDANDTSNVYLYDQTSDASQVFVNETHSLGNSQDNIVKSPGRDLVNASMIFIDSDAYESHHHHEQGLEVAQSDDTNQGYSLGHDQYSTNTMGTNTAVIAAAVPKAKKKGMSTSTVVVNLPSTLASNKASFAKPTSSTTAATKTATAQHQHSADHVSHTHSEQNQFHPPHTNTNTNTNTAHHHSHSYYSSSATNHRDQQHPQHQDYQGSQHQHTDSNTHASDYGHDYDYKHSATTDSYYNSHSHSNNQDYNQQYHQPPHSDTHYDYDYSNNQQYSDATATATATAADYDQYQHQYQQQYQPQHSTGDAYASHYYDTNNYQDQQDYQTHDQYQAYGQDNGQAYDQYQYEDQGQDQYQEADQGYYQHYDHNTNNTNNNDYDYDYTHDYTHDYPNDTNAATDYDHNQYTQQSEDYQDYHSTNTVNNTATTTDTANTPTDNTVRHMRVWEKFFENALLRKQLQEDRDRDSLQRHLQQETLLQHTASSTNDSDSDHMDPHSLRQRQSMVLTEQQVRDCLPVVDFHSVAARRYFSVRPTALHLPNIQVSTGDMEEVLVQLGSERRYSALMARTHASLDACMTQHRPALDGSGPGNARLLVQRVRAMTLSGLAFFAAVLQRDCEALHGLLLRVPATVLNALRDSHGRSLLHYAVRFDASHKGDVERYVQGKLEVVSLLMDYDLHYSLCHDCLDDCGLSPLHLAAINMDGSSVGAEGDVREVQQAAQLLYDHLLGFGADQHLVPSPPPPTSSSSSSLSIDKEKDRKMAVLRISAAELRDKLLATNKARTNINANTSSTTVASSQQGKPMPYIKKNSVRFKDNDRDQHAVDGNDVEGNTNTNTITNSSVKGSDWEVKQVREQLLNPSTSTNSNTTSKNSDSDSDDSDSHSKDQDFSLVVSVLLLIADYFLAFFHALLRPLRLSSQQKKRNKKQKKQQQQQDRDDESTDSDSDNEDHEEKTAASKKNPVNEANKAKTGSSAVASSFAASFSFLTRRNNNSNNSNNNNNNNNNSSSGGGGPAGRLGPPTDSELWNDLMRKQQQVQSHSHSHSHSNSSLATPRTQAIQAQESSKHLVPPKEVQVLLAMKKAQMSSSGSSSNNGVNPFSINTGTTNGPSSGNGTGSMPPGVSWRYVDVLKQDNKTYSSSR